jgi:chitinase
MMTRFPNPYSALTWRHSILILTLLAGSLSTVSSSASSAPQPKYKIIGYVGGRTNIYSIGAEKLTHINYAFALVSKEGRTDVQESERARTPEPASGAEGA